MANIHSDEQVSIFDWFKKGDGHLVVEAYAGTGKTYTIIEGINHAPEPTILLAAFNKRIQEELASKLGNPNAEALTLHSIGYRAVKRYWERIGVDNRGAREQALAEEVCGQQAPDPIKRLVGKLCTKAREIAPFTEDPADLEPLAVQFDLVPDDSWKGEGYDLQWVCKRALQAVEFAAMAKPVKTGIDFADMLFLPLVNRWLQPTYDLLVVDEAQDMTPVQLQLAQGVCRGRIAIVGDSHQAIYGFRGADSQSLGRLQQELGARKLGLTTTYRCGRRIVEEARRFVPAYRADALNGEGLIRSIDIGQVYDEVRAGDFVLSRTNAPLVSIALGLIRRDRPAKIEGRDIGAGLRAIINKLATGPAKSSIPKFLEKLGNWRDRETTRAEKAKLEHKVDQVLDQYETILALTDGVTGIPELLARLENLFAEVKGNAAAIIVCSSVHRAKGLERDRVFVLRDTLGLPAPCQTCRKRKFQCKCSGGYKPDPMAVREEQNIEYVAITRAKHELVWVDGKPARK